MSLFVDTSVWSLAFRRDAPPPCSEVRALMRTVEGGETVIATGLILQELLQGFSRPKARKAILNYFAALPLLAPDRRDHIEAAEVRNLCRHVGVQIGTIDAVLAQLCIRHGLTMLTTDDDFRRIAQRFPLKVWSD